MSRRAFGQAPSQDVCIFCACHLFGPRSISTPAIPSIARRRIQLRNIRTVNSNAIPAYRRHQSSQAVAQSDDTSTTLSEKDYLERLSQAAKAQAKASKARAQRNTQQSQGSERQDRPNGQRDGKIVTSRSIQISRKPPAAGTKEQTTRSASHRREPQGVAKAVEKQRGGKVTPTIGQSASKKEESARSHVDKKQTQSGSRRLTLEDAPRKVSLPAYLQADSRASSEKTAVSGWGGSTTLQNTVEYGEREIHEQEIESLEPSVPSLPDSQASPLPEPQRDTENESVASASSDQHSNEKPRVAVTRNPTHFQLFQRREASPPAAKVRGPSITFSSPRGDPPSHTADDILLDAVRDLGKRADGEARRASSRPTTLSSWVSGQRRIKLNFNEDYDQMPKYAARSAPYLELRDQASDTGPPQSEGMSVIDNLFDKYRQQRNPTDRNGSHSRDPTNSYSPLVKRTADGAEQTPAKLVCARCGQEGHNARNCDSAMQRSLRLDDRNRGTASIEKPVSWKSLNPIEEDRFTRRDTASSERRSAQATDVSAMSEEERSARSTSRDALSFDEAVAKTLTSKRFGSAPERKIRAHRGRREEEDEENDRYDYEDANDRAAQESRRAERQADKVRSKREREAAARRNAGAKITLPQYITVSNLAQALNVHYDSFIDKLEDLGYDDVFPGKILNAETSGLVAMEYGFDPQLLVEGQIDVEKDLVAQPEPATEDKEYLPSRPPVVTIMGHVDHGKTTLLDYLRNASVAAGEAGGITQHIGAFSVALEATGRTITFLDTPGHAAFLAMRQRGANVTDIVVLVVAADDSVKPQTLEALKHARAAKVPIIVAINKVDKPEADVQRVKTDLGRHGIEIEDYGGEVQVVEVSGKTGKGMDDLEEAIVTQSEVLDHRADTTGVVEGWVLEATTKASGRVATVLVRRGTLKIGDVIVAGRTWARVRTLRDDTGNIVREATPGMPVEVDGWREQPIAGDEVLEAESEQQAASVVNHREEVFERKRLAEDTEAINKVRMLEQLKKDGGDAKDEPAGTIKEESGPMQVPFVIKADVSGSAEAVEAYIQGVASPHIMPKILYAEVGQVDEGDIELASVGGGYIISFNRPVDEDMKAQAAARGVGILEHNIIYRALDEVKEILQDKLPPVFTQKVVGEADIGTLFEIGIGGRKKLKVAGCKVRNGVIGKTSRVRVMRGTTKIYDGAITSLKNVKKDVDEMRKGTECGIAFENWDEFEVNDVVQTYQEISEKRSLT